MKSFDRIGLAAKNLKGVWAVLPVAAIAVSMFCLCFAGAVRSSVQKEKSAPYELNVEAGSAKITDSAIAKIVKIADVTGATPVLEVPATVRTGEFAAKLTLVGINGAYLNGTFTQGGLFPESGVMPCIVLNEKACKRFKKAKAETKGGNQTDEAADSESPADTGKDGDAGTDEAADKDTGADTDKGADKDTDSGNTSNADKNADTDSGSADQNADAEPDESANDSGDSKAADIHWLKAEFTVRMEKRPVVSKVCGILKGGKEAAAYISLSSAKQLLASSGQDAGYTSAYVRVKNIGCAAKVTQALEALGLTADNSNNELQKKWDGELEKMTYLIIIAGFCLLCAAVLMASWRKISLLEQKKQWEMLKWMGFTQKDRVRLFLTQTSIVLLIGMAIGLVACLSLPSFLASDAKEASIFMLQPSYKVVAACFGACAAFSLLPFLFIRKNAR